MKSKFDDIVHYYIEHYTCIYSKRKCNDKGDDNTQCGYRVGESKTEKGGDNITANENDDDVDEKTATEHST